MDKIDGKIKENYYEEKFKEFSSEIESIDNLLSAQTKAGLKTQTLGAKIFDTAQKGSGAYIKKDIETKRELIRLIFEKIEISGTIVNFFYSKEFAILSKLVEQTNSSKLPKLIEKDNKIFELYNLSEISKKYAISEPQCSILLRLYLKIRTIFKKL